jgi:Ni/Fe-hydrogenase subunit HybB-like protein
MGGFIYPNEVAVQWDLLIVIYPYITGLVAGAFIVSSLYHVFGIKALKPVAQFSLVTALAFLLVCPIPLVVHLGRPERALEMLLRPNFFSAMSGFGFIWFFYFLILVSEVWLVFRPSIVHYARTSHGWKKKVYRLLSLGVEEVSQKSLGVDDKLIKFLAVLGIPVACLLHGYVGFIFGAVKSNPWWSTPLMPIIFLVSAVVSGIALLIVLYTLVSKIRKVPPDYPCLRSLALWLGGFLTVVFILEGLEVFSMLYESEESWGAIAQLITQKINITYLIVQFGMGSLLSLVILGGSEVFKMKAATKNALRVAASISVLIGVFAMRWNVVIGGQILSKSLRGFSSYVPPVGGLDGVVSGAVIMILPLVLLSVFAYFIPPWREEAAGSPETAGPLFRGFRTTGLN